MDTQEVIPQAIRIQSLGERGAKSFKVVAGEIVNKLGFAECIDHFPVGVDVVNECLASDLPSVRLPLLGLTEPIAKLLDREAIASRPGRSAGVQGVLLVEILSYGAIRIGPSPKIVKFTPDFLRLTLRSMGKKRKFGVGFRRLHADVRMAHVITSLAELVSLTPDGDRRRVFLMGFCCRVSLRDSNPC